MENSRLVSIDIARAICIILVVIGHFVPDNSPNWYVTIHDVIYTFHMPLFMFVSGYVYWATRKPIKYQKFVWKKFQRLMIPYFFASIVVISIKLLTEGGLSVENPVGIAAYYKMFYLPVAGAFLWFVFALFLIFLVIPFFNTRKNLLILLVISLLLFCIPVPLPSIFCLAKFKSNLLYFVLGCALFEWSNVRLVFDKIHYLIALFAFAVIYLLKSQVDFFVINKALKIIIACVGIIFILNLSKKIEQQTVTIKKIFLEISVYSYTIYLFHTTFEGFVKAILLRSHLSIISLNESLSFMCLALIVILAGVAIPSFIHIIMLKYSRLLLYFIGADNKTSRLRAKNANA